jgi:hypothetical protein
MKIAIQSGLSPTDAILHGDGLKISRKCNAYVRQQTTLRNDGQRRHFLGHISHFTMEITFQSAFYLRSFRIDCRRETWKLSAFYQLRAFTTRCWFRSEPLTIAAASDASEFMRHLQENEPDLGKIETGDIARRHFGGASEQDLVERLFRR